jgi:hypothetical protein
MKLNFWQILGLLLILFAGAFLIYERTGVKPADPLVPAMSAPVLPPASQPVP